jgi:hypothetical protein
MVAVTEDSSVGIPVRMEAAKRLCYLSIDLLTEVRRDVRFFNSEL